MTKASPKMAISSLQPKDWFLPAIEASGSVEQCLDAVLGELRARSAFVLAIKSCLVSRGASSQDLLTQLAQKIKIIGQTLEFRLGILAPDRPQAWFRAPAATTSGPFSSTLLPEPVFANEELWNIDQLKTELSTAWSSRSTGSLTLLGEGASLWRTLLTLNTELENICVLPEPYGNFRLDILPDGLTISLESRPLRAFLLNVRQEIKSARDKLDDCYARLWNACEPFWDVQKKSQPASRPRSRVFTGGGAGFSADRARDEFRQRRARQVRSVFLTPADMEAMQFLGFEDLPSHESLRQRYLTLAKKLHPDRQAGCDEGFKQLSSAYERLLARVQVGRP